MTYAAQTTVSAEKSRAEIERILMRYKATHFGYMATPETAAIAFQAAGRRLRFTLPLPKRSEHKTDKRGYWRSDTAIDKAWDQSLRQRWRALALGHQSQTGSRGGWRIDVRGRVHGEHYLAVRSDDGRVRTTADSAGLRDGIDAAAAGLHAMTTHTSTEKSDG